MAYNKNQFKSLIERVLKAIDLYSEAAVNLLLGTAAQESKFGTYLKQLGTGPALSPFQIEPPTFRWLQRKYQDKYPYIKGRSAEEMEWDLKLAIIMCRLRYRIVPKSLPAANDTGGLARYWKRYYNTYKGAGTEAEFLSNYAKYLS